MAKATLATSILCLLTLLPACREESELFPGEADDPVALGAAGEYAILAKSGISTGSPSTITGDVGISPASASAITGFELTMDPANQFATSPQVTGKIYAADYAAPTPENLKSAMDDLNRAYKDARKRNASSNELGGGDIGGQILTGGVYDWNTTLLIPGDITLNGDVTDVWIFKVKDDLIMTSGTEVMLAGTAMADNVFWQVGGRVDIGEAAKAVGTFLAKDSITLRKGAVVDGRLLSQSKVSLDGSTVVAPGN